MSIVSSTIITNRPYGSSSIKIREEHIDHLGNKYYQQYIADIGYDVDAALAQHAIQINQQTIDNEIVRGISLYENGVDPLHFEASQDNWQKITPDYQLWGDLAAAVTIDFLERIDQLELVSIETIIIRISTTDKRNLWGMSAPEVSDVNAAIQTAVNTKASLDLYAPFFVDGVKV